MQFFSLYLNIRGLRKGPGKFFMVVLEKSWIFFVSKRVWTLLLVSVSTCEFVERQSWASCLLIVSHVKMCTGVTNSSAGVSLSSTLPLALNSSPAYAAAGFFTVSSAKSSAPVTQTSPIFSFSASSSSAVTSTTTTALGGSTFSSGGFTANPGSGFSFGTGGGFTFGSQPSASVATQQQPASDGTNTAEGLYQWLSIFSC